ncbi:unnamed protein product [Orchesella dallaii]|uniref:Uncharacterized protein n=1 Tax=Orchesella dallaii TaxID=48710 RepID=A0ABP1S4K0_9HEXA
MKATMRGGTSFVHMLSVGWTLITVLIVSSSPNRSSSLSVSGASPISSGERRQSITSFQEKIKDPLSPSSSFSTVITNSNQFSSTFSSFTVLQRDEPSFKKMGSGDRGNIISTNRPLQLTFFTRRKPMVFNSAIDDTDKSDNQISSRIVPFPPAGSRTNKTKTNSSDVNMPNPLQIDKDETSSSSAGTSISSSPTTPTISFFIRPKRQMHPQQASSSSSSSPTSPIIFSELANVKVGRRKSPANISPAGETVFTETAYPDHILTEPISMPVTSAVSVRGRRVRAKGKGADKTLTILGLFELTQNSLARESGRSEKIAAEMALEDINAKGILPGYRLTMHTNDTQASSCRVVSIINVD